MNFVLPYSWESFQKRLNQAEKDGSSHITWKVFKHKLWIFKPSNFWDEIIQFNRPQGPYTTNLSVDIVQCDLNGAPESHN